MKAGKTFARTQSIRRRGGSIFVRGLCRLRARGLIPPFLFFAVIVLLGCAVCLALPSAAARAQDRGTTLELQEQKIKAGLVYNFLKYTTWPVSGKADRRLHICLYGGDPFDGYLYPLRGRTAKQNVITISEIDKVEDADDCHLLFIHPSEEKNLPDVLRSLRGRNILTTSDIGGFATRGGMVEFATQNQKISVYINKNAIRAAGLDVDNRLLKFAKLVSERPE